MAGELASLRSSLESTLEDAWDDQESARGQLGQSLSGVADEIAECINASSSNPAECIEDVMENNDVGDGLSTTWDTNLQNLKSELRSSVADEWSASDRDVVRQLAQDANLDMLNTLCMRGRYDEVEDRLNLEQDQVQDQLAGIGAPTAIDNTASNCLAIVNHLSGFAENLDQAFQSQG